MPMQEILIQPSHWSKFEIAIEIDADTETVWHALIDEINHWWTADFRVFGPSSVVSLDVAAGGAGLLETGEDGAALQWYQVQMFAPAEKTLYLVGWIAPDWGGPMVSHLKWVVGSASNGSVLRICDSRQGNVAREHEQACRDGWCRLFTNGLKQYVEGNRRNGGPG